MENPEAPSKNRSHIKEFSADESTLSYEDKQILQIYKKSTELFAQVFDIQRQTPFYPPDVSKRDIQEYAKEQPNILNHYNVVTKESEGFLSTIPYHIVFADALAPVTSALRDAAELTTNLQQKKYLELKAGAFETGAYEEAEKAWLEMDEEPMVDIGIGFYEKYMDRDHGMKFAAMAWVGIKDTEKTDLAQNISDKYLEKEGWMGPRVRSRVERTTMFSGLIAYGLPSATSLPNQKEWREKYGTKIIFFETANEAFLKKEIPILRSIYDDSESFTDKQIGDISFKLLAAHESFHPLIRYEGDEERLSSEYTYINELLPEVLAGKVSTELVGDIVSEKELKLVLPLIVSKALTRLADGARLEDPYITGWATLINFIKENGGIVIVDRKIKIVSDEKIQESVRLLSAKLQEIAKNGNAQVARDLRENYGDVNVFDEFRLGPSRLDIADTKEESK